jgi:hypothetical protein
LKAGENGLIPEPTVMWMPPPPLGSGKFGTPWERMHFENARNWAWSLDPRPVAGLLEEPQAASPITQVSVASVIEARWHWLPIGPRFTRPLITRR